MVLAKRAVSSRIPALMTAGTKLPAFAAQNDSLPSAIFSCRKYAGNCGIERTGAAIEMPRSSRHWATSAGDCKFLEFC